ncbi:F-box only protein 2 isoform X1 [Mustela putorius furo]|uniref:F-box only protein 2 isoform X1 n=1 Tax=Mustela putorius furo TaxID=9669 RepID=A0A8U0UMJ2_MUSPF|nr:F-box only protein 2 isoform X1 [Mustela putorius furo]
MGPAVFPGLSCSPPGPSAESVGQPEEEVSPEGQQEEAGAEEASAGEERPEEEEEEAAAAPYLDELPEPLLLRVLAELPAAQLVQACRLVCLRWKELVDGAPLWLLKCQQEGLVPEGGAEDERDHWQQFYFLSKRRRNLLRNPCGEEDLEGWCDVEHGGDGWRVEDLPGDCGAEFIHDESVKKYFASSFEWCRKAQVIDLQAEGYWEELLDTTQPAIVAKDWYSGRSDAGCLYELTVKLLSEHEDVLAEFSSGQVAVPPDSDDAGWIQISHTFTDYGPGVRFVRFEHGGQDSVYWKGWFGARVTNSSVWVEP